MRWPRRRTFLTVGAMVAVSALVVGFALRQPVIYDTILRADRITVYEGLPHSMYEEVVYRDELKHKATIRLEDFDFYKAPLVMSEEDRRALVSLLGSASTYEAYSGEKKCGGFHADYAVEWSTGGEVYRCLICFGCSEARVGRPSVLQSYDLRTGSDGRSALKGLLKRYRVSRPPHQYFGLTPVDD